MAISPEQIISAITDDIRSTFGELTDKLAMFSERSARYAAFRESVDQLPAEAKLVLDLSTQKELQHTEHVRKTLNRIPEHPKDELYFFATSARFDYRIRKTSAERLFRMEAERHYSLEPHHEEFEKIQNGECNDDDIREMAIDRMSRNIQANRGVVHMDQMTRYVPNFPLGDNKGKQDIFKEYLVLYKGITELTYQHLFHSDS